MVFCVGEILVDLIGSDKNGVFSYERYAGGAPFNVACGIGALGGVSGFYGCVGNDSLGGFLNAFAQSMPVKNAVIELSPKHNTTVAFVELDSSGERRFCFMRKNGADYFLEEKSVIFPKETNIVHIGSLMLSEPEGRSAAAAIIKKAKSSGLLVSFDVNYRDDIFPDAASACKIYKEFAGYADILKMSEDELLMFSGTNDLFASVDAVKMDSQLLCVTLGAKGSLYSYGAYTGIVDSIKVKPVDTTGAGDAFFAGILYSLQSGGLSGLTKERLDKIFKFSNICGALATTKKGAITALPSMEDVKKFL